MLPVVKVEMASVQPSRWSGFHDVSGFIGVDWSPSDSLLFATVNLQGRLQLWKFKENKCRKAFIHSNTKFASLFDESRREAWTNPDDTLDTRQLECVDTIEFANDVTNTSTYSSSKPSVNAVKFSIDGEKIVAIYNGQLVVVSFVSFCFVLKCTLFCFATTPAIFDLVFVVDIYGF